tara:strand:+ start:152 stop:262 length:111 start_codon:yes stop_codon:yes gene_type:complete
MFSERLRKTDMVYGKIAIAGVLLVLFLEVLSKTYIA